MSYVTLYHYTKRTSAIGILQARKVRPSTGTKHAQYGPGVYLTSMAPGSHNMDQVSAALHANPGNLIPPDKNQVAFVFRIPNHEVRRVDPQRDVWLYDRGDLSLDYSTGEIYVGTETGAYVRGNPWYLDP